MYVMVRSLPIDDDLPAPDGRKAGRGKGHEFREIHRPRARFRSVRAIAGPARGPPAIFARASAQGAARRPRRARRRPDRPLRRQFARRRCTAVEAALAKRPKVSGGGAGQVYLDPALARVFDAAAEDRREGRRQLRHRRAAAAGAGAREGQRRRQDPGRRRRHAAESQRRHRGAAQGPHRRLARRPRTPTTR